MTEFDSSEPGDLSGTVDERIAELDSIATTGQSMTEEWLRRQLDDALSCWASDASLVVIGTESRVDF